MRNENLRFSIDSEETAEVGSGRSQPLPSLLLTPKGTKLRQNAKAKKTTCGSSVREETGYVGISAIRCSTASVSGKVKNFTPSVHFQDFGLTFHLKSYHSMCIIPSVSLPSSWHGIWISEGTHAGAWLRLLTCTFSRAQPKICSQASKKHWFACRPFILLKEVPKASD